MSVKPTALEPEIPEDLKQSAEDEAFVDAFVERNRPALEKMIEEARASLARGEGITVRSREDFLAAIRSRFADHDGK
jgi:hypothetical protein